MPKRSFYKIWRQDVSEWSAREKDEKFIELKIDVIFEGGEGGEESFFFPLPLFIQRLKGVLLWVKLHALTSLYLKKLKNAQTL